MKTIVKVVIFVAVVVGDIIGISKIASAIRWGLSPPFCVYVWTETPMPIVNGQHDTLEGLDRLEENHRTLVGIVSRVVGSDEWVAICADGGAGPEDLQRLNERRHAEIWVESNCERLLDRPY